MGNFRNLLESHDHLAQDQRPKTSWSRAGTRTAPGMGFLKKLQLQKFLRMIKWVIQDVFREPGPSGPRPEAKYIMETRDQRHHGVGQEQRQPLEWVSRKSCNYKSFWGC